MSVPPHLRRHDRITIELCEVGPDDGRRLGAGMRVLVDGLCTVPRYRPSLAEPAHEPAPFEPVDLRVWWQWDGSTTDDGAYRFRRQ